MSLWTASSDLVGGVHTPASVKQQNRETRKTRAAEDGGHPSLQNNNPRSFSSLARVSFHTAHLPSPKPTLTLTSHLGQNVGLGEGQVGSFPQTYDDPKKGTARSLVSLQMQLYFQVSLLFAQQSRLPTQTNWRSLEWWVEFHYAKYIFTSSSYWKTFYSPVTIRKDPSATLLAGPKLDGPLEISDSSGMLPGQGIQDLAPSALQSEKEHSSLAVSLENNMHRVCTLLLM